MKSVSVILATLNSGPILKKSLKSIRSQDYDQKKIEVIAADGGSVDDTVKTLKKYGAKIIPENTGSPESAKGVALQYAKNELILEIDCDNILPDKNWLKKMVSYFDKEKNIVGVYPWKYKHEKDDKPLNRYFSLIGANDPVARYLGKADRQSYIDQKWCLSGRAKDRGDYFLLEFNPDNLPTVGANGFLIKRSLLLKAKVENGYFYHIDTNMDLVKKGFNKYVVVKNDIYHASGESFWHFLKKRKKYMEKLYLKDLSKRRYFIYKKDKDRKKIIAYSFYALTFVGPTIESSRGFFKVRDWAWFLHPLLCFIMFWIYFLAVLNWQSWHYLGQAKKRLNL